MGGIQRELVGVNELSAHGVSGRMSLPCSAPCSAGFVIRLSRV